MFNLNLLLTKTRYLGRVVSRFVLCIILSQDMDLRAELGLQEIRDLPDDVLNLAYETLVPSERRLPDSFWARYGKTKRSFGLRAGFSRILKICLENSR